ncbi:MAG: ribosomal protein S18-alanine N-acetyltransferase [Bacillota bacterium]|nr:ribosomal protein S18-alanine N-acetyltransferase [Bacillota bacterium]
MELKLRLAKMAENHLDQVLAIEGVSFPTPWTRKAFLSELYENSFACYIVCLDETANDKVIGYAGMWIILDEIHITNIAVRNEYKGNRIGEFLLNHLFSLGRIKGALRATLEVRPSNISAQNLYLRIGFKSFGRRKSYYQDNGEDAIVMWKELS